MNTPRSTGRMCSRCVMDESDRDITFDASGVCSNCHAFDARMAEIEDLRARDSWDAVVERLKQEGRGKKYDAIVGLSGGVDSSYVALIAARAGLRILAVHLDNGWNSELAVNNIESLVSKLGIELHTHVIDWEVFRDLQVAYLRAGVIDIEALTDHAIKAVLFQTAAEEGVHTILGGQNVATEGILPSSWNYRKADLRNLKAIAKKNGANRFDTYPTASTLKLAFYKEVKGVRLVHPLNLIADYDRQMAVDALAAEVGWRDYGGKHWESFFTRFYQAHILPTKFGVDKRRAHLATAVAAGAMTRDEALAKLDEPMLDALTLEHDRTYVAKKFGMTEEEFDAILAAPPVPHTAYPTDLAYAKVGLKLFQIMSKLRSGRGEDPRRGAPAPVATGS